MVSMARTAMQASKFEFEQRFWIFGAIFFVGFFLYNFDRVTAAVALLHEVAPSIDPDTRTGNNLLRGIFGFGTLLVFFAAAYRTWATAYLRTEIVHDMTQHATSVVADGPYRYSRNPLYFANLFMAAGIGLMASRTGCLFIVIAVFVFDARLILREEAGLIASQGETYRRYLAAVPRFWPSPRPRVPASGVQPRWGQAFAGESMFWIFGLAMLAFTITLNSRVTGIVFVIAFVVYFAAVYTIKNRAAARR
jgi:protein-S-isoprenylcysteine O-methyltransferase Ste14